MQNEKDESTAVTNFFQALAERAYKENDLSDVTYALCRADRAFQQFFLDFFFPKANLRAESIRSFEREHSDALGRPDFWIETKDGELYIVEVKIWDWNQHFEQYHELLIKQHGKTGQDKKYWDHLGYIANYQVKSTEKGMSVNKECGVHTWHEFKLALEKEGCSKSLLVAAYMKYLKSLCHFHEVKIPEGWHVKGADFKLFRDLVVQFNESIKGEKRCKVYSKSKRNFASQWCFGEFFELMDFGTKGVSVWGWFGAYYAADGINICVEFEDRQGWGKPVCDKFREDGKIEDGALRFWIGKHAEEEIEINQFFHTVISLVEGKARLSDKFSGDIAFAEENAKCFKKWALAMKLLPFVLETKLVTPEFSEKLASKGYFIELSVDEDQWCHCGRDFTLKPISSKKPNVQRLQQGIFGWLGVVFKNGNKNARGKSLKEFPTFVVEMDMSYLGDKVKSRSKDVAWYKDDYDFGCHDIYIDGDGRDFNEVLEAARKVILEVLK